MQRFLSMWLVLGLVAMMAVVVANAVIDPYGIVGTPAMDGLNAVKTAAANRPRLAKAYLIDRVDPKTLISGTSDSDIGIDPEADAFPQGLRPAFNMAIDGGSPVELLMFLRHAMDRPNVRLVLLGISFEDSMLMPNLGPDGIDPSDVQTARRLRYRPDGSPNPDLWKGRLVDAAFAFISSQALLDSALTPLRQRWHERNAMTRLGWNTGSSFARWTQEDGAEAVFRNKESSRPAVFWKWSAAPRLQVTPILDMVRLAQARQARMVVFIQPTHVDQLLIMHELGLEQAWEQWKASVVQSLASSLGDGAELWDFSGYSQFTTEPVPPVGDKGNEPRWFWEPIHYRSTLGDLMVRRMLGDDRLSGFGVRLAPETVDRHIADVRAAGLRWRAQNPSAVARIKALVDTQRSALCDAQLRCKAPSPQQLRFQ